MIWHVSIEFAGEGRSPSEEDLLRLLSALGSEASVSGPAEEPLDDLGRYGADVSLTTADAGGAVTGALAAVSEAIAAVGLPAWPVTRLEVKSDDELDRELSRPNFPELIGVTELAHLLGVTRQRASMLAQRADFPGPVAVLASGPVWTAPSVRRFTDAWTRRPGRPKKAPTVETTTAKKASPAKAS